MQEVYEHYHFEIRGSEWKSRAIEKTSSVMQAWPHNPVSALDRDFEAAVGERSDQSPRRAKFYLAGCPEPMLDFALGHRSRMMRRVPCREFS